MATVSDPVETPGQECPVLRIEGGATDVEVAALVAVLQGMAAAGDGESPGPRPSEWSAPHRLHRQPPRTGPGAWRAGALPR
jgi:hypothetical protein